MIIALKPGYGSCQKYVQISYKFISDIQMNYFDYFANPFKRIKQWVCQKTDKMFM